VDSSSCSGIQLTFTLPFLCRTTNLSNAA
jgi:hypothetical protein